MDYNKLYKDHEGWLVTLAVKYPIINYTFDDTKQEYGLVFMSCVEKYDAKKGKLTTVLNTACRNKMISLNATQFFKGKHPLYSLDKEIVENGKRITGIDLITDKTNLGSSKSVIGKVKTIVEALHQLPRGDITIDLYLNNITLESVAKKLGISIQRVFMLNKINLAKARKLIERLVE